jgi:hypothetical protein
LAIENSAECHSAESYSVYCRLTESHCAVCNSDKNNSGDGHAVECFSAYCRMAECHSTLRHSAGRRGARRMAFEKEKLSKF